MEPTVSLKELFNGIVSAIHEKDGLSDGIYAYNFPDRINAIQTGVPLQSISIETPPQKTTYTVGETFNPNGMEIAINFENGYSFLLDNSDWEFSPVGPLALGEEDITISFQWGNNMFYVEQPISVVKLSGWYSPHMTSNNTPAPYIAFSSSSSSGCLPYFAFDGTNPNSTTTGFWSSAQKDNNAYLGIDFGIKTNFAGVRLKSRTYSVGAQQFPKTVYIDISDDKNTWETIFTKTNIPMQTSGDIWVVTAEFDNPINARYVRFSHLSDGGFYMSNLVSIGDVEFKIYE